MPVNKLLDSIRTRRVIRDFTEETVTRTDLLQVMDAARWAPSAGNRRLHRFIAIQDPITIKLIRAVSPGIHGHPTALVVISIDWAKVARLGCKPHNPGVYIDVGTAAENMLLAAHSMGLGAGPMTSFSKEGVRVILGLPDWLSPELMICLGHPGTPRSSPRRPAKPTRLEDLVSWERFSPLEN